ncbi:MAG: thioredoxin-like domain-containing protein [Candidatus Riflebacteria bacterium]|jgi:nucleoredoxin|nr:thioredoxin-like domain-containing protein [Candidatus Riflebacteria bacterium]
MNAKNLKIALQRTLVILLFLVAAGNVFATGNSVAQPVLDEFFPDGLIDADQQYYDNDRLEGKVFALYFSASWCRGCAAFSRILVPFRNRHQENFEVVLVGFDHSAIEMQSYMKTYEMLWPAIAWDNPARLAVKERFQVSEIPALIVIAPDGRVITTEGYKQIDHMGDAALENWLKIAQSGSDGD